MSSDFIGQNHFVTIAKVQRCSDCSRLFSAGQQMRYQSGKRNGVFFSRYYCLKCWRWRRIGDFLKGIFHRKVK